MSGGGFPTLPAPGQNTPPATDFLRLLAKQLFEEIDNEHRRGLGFAALRQVEVTATDPATQTATVILGGDLDNPIAGVKTLPGYVPVAGDVCWAHQNGSDLLLAGGPGLELPKVKVRKGGTSAVPNGSDVAITFGVGAPLYYDRYSMWDAVNNRIVFPWPGKYQFGYQAHWDDAVGGRRIAEIADQDGFVRAGERLEWDTADVSAKDPTTNPIGEHAFTAGQWVQVKVYQSSGASLSILDEPASNVFWAHYLP